MFIRQESLDQALGKLYGTAGHLLKIWFTLKHMGLKAGSSPIEIDTSNSTPSLERLFSYGAPDGGFYVPFAHTRRYMIMKDHAARSIVQTTIERWASSGSVVTCDPTEYLDISRNDGSGKLSVSTSRKYPFGLGHGESGFALEDGKRVQIPITSFSIWYGRQTDIPQTADPKAFLVEAMLSELNISPAERELIFEEDPISVLTQPTLLSQEQIFQSCQPYISGDRQSTVQLQQENFSEYTRRVKSMITGLEKPRWMRLPPEDEVKGLISGGAKAILLYGPPRTGKSWLIDTIMPRTSPERATIQIHDGWGYDNLIEGFKPDQTGSWGWVDGPLKRAIKERKKLIVLEEINRTSISQALGEVFSLIEDAYRGEDNAITLRSEEKLSIDEDTLFVLTMNTVDKSTEEVDDALMGRVAAIEFPPRAETLAAMMHKADIDKDQISNITQLFSEIQKIYPLGHGYFASMLNNLKKNQAQLSNEKVITHYKARIRPVMQNFLGDLRKSDLETIDNLVDELFGSP